MNREYFQQIVQAIVGTLISILIGFIAWQTNRWSGSIDEISKSVSQLNTKIEVVMTQFGTNNEFTRQSIADHEERIRALEGKK